jgi:hypothetical protein
LLKVGLEAMPEHIEGFTVVDSKGFIIIINTNLSLEKQVEILNKEYESMEKGEA